MSRSGNNACLRTGASGHAAECISGSCALAAAVVVAGCAALLPVGHNTVQSPWKSFDEAKATIERIEPYRTRVADLTAIGIDPYRDPNVTLLTYSDVVLRFPSGAAVPAERLDRGIRDCLYAGKACYGYAVNVRDVRRERTGNFWLDSFGFRRETEVSGWTFNALLLVVDDVVVYTLFGGQPLIREHESSRQPLGPLQDLGENIPQRVP
jgi:hypothetical protein